MARPPEFPVDKATELPMELDWGERLWCAGAFRPRPRLPRLTSISPDSRPIVTERRPADLDMRPKLAQTAAPKRRTSAEITHGLDEVRPVVSGNLSGLNNSDIVASMLTTARTTPAGG